MRRWFERYRLRRDEPCPECGRRIGDDQEVCLFEEKTMHLECGRRAYRRKVAKAILSVKQQHKSDK